MKNCTNCGQELSEDCVFCWKCGASNERFISNEEVSISKNACYSESQGLEIENGVLNDIGTCKDTNIIIPHYVTSIGNWTFSWCTGLTSVTIPNSVTRIGERAFYNCTGLKEINFSGTTKQWKTIKKGEGWNNGTNKYKVICNDVVI